MSIFCCSIDSFCWYECARKCLSDRPQELELDTISRWPENLMRRSMSNEDKTQHPVIESKVDVHSWSDDGVKSGTGKSAAPSRRPSSCGQYTHERLFTPTFYLTLKVQLLRFSAATSLFEYTLWHKLKPAVESLDHHHSLAPWVLSIRYVTQRD